MHCIIVPYAGCGMAPIDPNLFNGEEEINPEELHRLQIMNYSTDVDETLREYGWRSKPVGCIVLKLSADNVTVTSGQFVARGQLTREETRIEANKIWAEAEQEGQILVSNRTCNL